jgi:hypothetical protein
MKFVKKLYYFLVPISMAFALRSYPTFLSGLPFSVDSWEVIKNTELLINLTPIPLSEKVFRTYDNYWPAHSIFGAAVSIITGVKPIKAMPVFFAAIGALTILIFFVFVKRLYNAEVAFIASILFATFFPHTIMTASICKETYANPLYLLLIFTFFNANMVKWEKIFLFTLLSTSLTLTHLLTSGISALFLLFVTLILMVQKIKGCSIFKEVDLSLVSILMVIISLYNGLYSRPFLQALTWSDILSLTSYLILAFALDDYLVNRKIRCESEGGNEKKDETNLTSGYAQFSNVKTGITGLAITALVVLLGFMIINRPLTEGAPILPRHYLLYITPYAICVSVATLGYAYLRHQKECIILLSWLSPIIGIGAYTIFDASSPGYIWTYRLLNFLIPPLSILTAVGLHRLNRANVSSKLGKATKLLIAITILLSASISSYNLYAAVVSEEPYLGYFWKYNLQEFQAAKMIATNNITVAGDVKMLCLLGDYFDVNVDVFQGFNYLKGTSDLTAQVLLIYSQMFRNGYALFGCYSLNLPENWTEKIYNLNVIYFNGVVGIYGRVT